MDRLMKDSGAEWIGKIPEKWEMRKLKYILCERNEKNDPIITRDILSLTAAQGVIPYSEKEGGGNKPKDDFSAYKIARPNDVVMNSMNILSGSVGLSKYFGCVSPVYYMLYSDSEDVNIEFYNYIFQTSIFQKSLRGLGNGIMMKETEDGKLNTIRMRIPMEKLGGLLLPLPNGETQNKIVNYLNAIVPEIDNVIETTKATIEDYKKYKQALITEAVTKGLNPDVEMKDSGIEWIGKIPERWEVVHLKNFVKVNNGKEIKNDISIESDNKIDVFGSGGVFKYTDEFLYNGESVLFGRKGTIGKPLYVNQKFWTVDTMYFLTYKEQLLPKFNYYQLIAFDWEPYTTKTALPSIVGSDIVALGFPIPETIEEQQKIVDYLDEKCTEIDNLISAKEQLVEDMESYKKSLIYEYVTGKKEVSDNE